MVDHQFVRVEQNIDGDYLIGGLRDSRNESQRASEHGGKEVLSGSGFH
jgi:hypothetical protein